MSQLDRDPVPPSAPPREPSLDQTRARRWAALGALGAALTVLSGAVVALAVAPRSDVSDEQFSSPWSSAALVPVSLAFAVFHVLVLVGVLGLMRSGLPGRTRSARGGGAMALAGCVVLTIAELASIAVRDQAMSDSGAGVVGAAFGLGTALSMVGFLMLGVMTLRAGRWSGWGRFTPLAVGLSLVALMGLVMTPALAAGVGLYGLALLVTFVAVAGHR